MNFSKYQTFVFDLDGTIWNTKKLFPEIAQTIEWLRKKNKQVLFISNHTITARVDLVKKLQNLGLHIHENELITATEGAREFLKGKRGKILVLGAGVKKDFKRFGIKFTDKLPVKYVVLGHDPTIDYKKLAMIYKASSKGATVLTTGVGRLFSYGNEMLPGMGAFVAAIELMTQKKVLFVGKPSKYMAKLILRKVKGKRVVMFGDEMNDDIPFAKSLGWTAVLVLTGVDKKVYGKVRPDFILKSVADIKL
jgi:HAD superfamily hydrolase (TIGR01450 family)